MNEVSYLIFKLKTLRRIFKNISILVWIFLILDFLLSFFFYKSVLLFPVFLEYDEVGFVIYILIIGIISSFSSRVKGELDETIKHLENTTKTD